MFSVNTRTVKIPKNGGKMVKYLCLLAPDLNTCENYDPTTGSCKKHGCGMLRVEDDSQVVEKYQRKERWYEKYYK